MFWIYDADARVSYELLSVIHQGGEGVTWRGLQSGHSRVDLPVAVKILDHQNYFQPELRTQQIADRWRGQGEIVRYFSDHTFVPIQAVFDISAVPGRPEPPDHLIGVPAVVTAWVNGDSLRSWSLQVSDPIARLNVLRSFAPALDRFHTESNHVHRDLNPNNVLVAADGQARVIDYGLLRDASIARRGTKPVGTSGYLAPEIIEGQPYSAATDLFSFAGILYHQLLLADPPELGTRHPASLVRKRLVDGDFAAVASLLAGWLHDDPAARTSAAGANAMLGQLTQLLKPAISTGQPPYPPPATTSANQSAGSEQTASDSNGPQGPSSLVQLSLRRTLLPAVIAFVFILAAYTAVHLL